MSFPANEVEQALLTASRSPQRTGPLLAALRQGSLWVPTTDDPTPDRQATLYSLEVEGVPHTVVFTSLEQLDRWRSGAPHLVAPTESFVASLPATVGLAVNPGGDLGLPLSPEQLDELRPARRVVPAGTRIRVGEPAQEPDEVLAQVAYALGDVPGVSAARRAWVQIADSAPSLAVGLELGAPLAPRADADAADVLLGTVREALDDVLARSRPGFAIDLVLLADAEDPISAWMLAHAEPFYRAT